MIHLDPYKYKHSFFSEGLLRYSVDESANYFRLPWFPSLYSHRHEKDKDKIHALWRREALGLLAIVNQLIEEKDAADRRR